MEVFDQRFLRAFMVVAQEGSIRKAAERLNIAPSAISRKLSDAEIRTGIRLMERHAQGIRLTEAGRLLLDHASQQAQEQAHLLDRLGQLRGEGQRAVRLGVGEGFAADLVQNGLGPLLRDQPGLRYAIHMAGSDELVAMAGAGQVDIAIAYNPILTPEARAIAIGRQPLCAVVPAGWRGGSDRNDRSRQGNGSGPGNGITPGRVAGPGRRAAPGRGAAGSVHLAEVLAQPLAILSPQHGIRQLVARAASDMGLALQPVVETDSIAMLLRFVSAGLGVTFLPRCSAALQERRGELAILDLDEPVLHDASVHMLIRARRRLPAHVAQVAEALAAGMEAFAAG